LSRSTIVVAAAGVSSGGVVIAGVSIVDVPTAGLLTTDAFSMRGLSNAGGTIADGCAPTVGTSWSAVSDGGTKAGPCVAAVATAGTPTTSGSDCFAAPIALPQLLQNLAPEGEGLPQVGQSTAFA
jgi:hypothetical protein